MESQSSLEQDRRYVRKAPSDLTEEERQYNENLFDETLALLFPEEKMRDKFYRDKVSWAGDRHIYEVKETNTRHQL